MIEPNSLHAGDCLELLRSMPDNSVDLILGSPPYEAARTYGVGFKLRGQAWVDWALPRYLECVRVSRGLVAWVVEGQTRDFRYSATPILLMAELHRTGVNLRKPAIYERDGIPGSGGPDWLKNRYEFIVCATPSGRLPWSNPKAMGNPPKFPPGGNPSNRKTTGDRVGTKMTMRRSKLNSDRGGGRSTDGEYSWTYVPPNIANPGNVIKCGAAGGGNIGNKLAHENEAPFPERVPEFFIRSFCPPNGIVLDPFIGSGTTADAAVKHGRQYIGFDVRQSQIDLTRRRLGIEAEVA